MCIICCLIWFSVFFAVFTPSPLVFSEINFVCLVKIVLLPTYNQVCQTLNITIYQFVHDDIPSSSTCGNDLMWFNDRFDIFVHCVGGHDLLNLVIFQISLN
jgi:hypothetical protein